MSGVVVAAAAVVGTVVFASSAVQAGTYKVVRSGQMIKVDNFYSVGPDCRSLGKTTINLVASPQNGQVLSRTGMDYSNFPTTNTHSKCNNRRLPSTLVFYRSAPGFVGNDSFSVEAVFPTGNAKQTTYSVSVR